MSAERRPDTVHLNLTNPIERQTLKYLHEAGRLCDGTLAELESIPESVLEVQLEPIPAREGKLCKYHLLVAEPATLKSK